MIITSKAEWRKLYATMVKIKVKLTEHHTTKVHWGNGGVAPCIDLGT
jgi:hypothetical protein